VTSTGAGSVVDLSALGTFTNVGGYYGNSVLSVGDSGQVLVSPTLTALDHVYVTVGKGALFPTHQLQSITNGGITVDTTAAAFSGLTDIHGSSIALQNGGTADFHNVTDADFTNLSVSGGVTLSLPQVQSYQDNNAPWQASGAGSVLDLSGI